MLHPIFWLAPLGSVLALFFAWLFYRQMKKKSEGTDKMAQIASYVRKGAMAYLKQQYTVVAIVFVCLIVLLSFLAFVLKVQNKWVPVAFLTGGFFSALSGYLGMKTATYASSRTANAARSSLNSALTIAFRSGAVMGLTVVGLALLDISLWFLILRHFYPISNENNLIIITTTMLTFGMGASTQALFARVGGGIFTKGADVGADLVGKVESNIPEDDPRNPAVIADNVGDNVGDVAGMGADLYESYAGSILATAALGASAFLGQGDMQLKAVIAPMAIAGIGTILSILGIFMVRTGEKASQKELLRALSRGINTSAILIFIFSYLIIRSLGMTIGNWLAVVAGLLSGIIIGKSTEYYTSHSYKPTKRIAESAKTGAATVIITGIGTAMLSTWLPIIAVASGTILAYLFAANFNLLDVGHGLYGIGIAAVGMLSTLGITLSTDAYGPIADNAGGNAQMSNLEAEVRQRTDALDALGNTTAATGKGFAIGSAALTALALLASYVEEIKMGLVRIGQTTLQMLDGTTIETAKAGFLDFMQYFRVNLMNPIVLVGMFIGAMMAFVFCGLTMMAVGKAAGSMVDEVRRQFKEIPGVWEGTAEPDYARCVAISTKGAQKAMMVPSLLAIIVPVATGLLLGVAGVMGLLIGATSTGFVLAVF
ncbi:MAG TPA: sodium-translocating pyrophosphatase, partial [Candidatus Saccharicenans sp.]|nr:sodium-translocating pyrophosphatase [Candidatus Saccharicenans sp.]